MTTSWTDADRDAVRRRLYDLASRLPDVILAEESGHTAFLVRKRRFAYLLVDHGHGRLALAAKAPEGDAAALVAADPERYFSPAYVGPRGWVGADLAPAARPDWPEAEALFEQAWRMTASKRAINAYDLRMGRGPEPSRADLPGR